MNELTNILNKVLAEVKLSKENHEKILSIVHEIIEKIYEELSSRSYIKSRNDLFIGGSFSRNTVLKDDFDIDIFIRFAPQYDIKELSNVVIEVSKKIFGEDAINLRYAEHPYVEAKYGELSFNIVPSYKVDPPNWLSAVDRSYFHTLYLDEHFRPELVNEVLLLKSFLKGIGCYGAEVTNKGFSGYLSELLVIKYGSFINLLKEVASRWRPPVIIDGGKYTKKELKILFPNAAIILLDPVDKKRNVASAVSHTTLARFISAAKAFLEKPRLEFFHPFSKKALYEYVNKVPIDNLINLPIIAIYLKHKPQIEDIFYSQLEKLMRKVAKQLQLNEVDILKMEAFSNFKDKSLILYLLSSRHLKELRKLDGPLVYIKSEHDFLTKNKNKVILWIGDYSRWYKVEYNKYVEIKDLLEDILNSKVNIPSHIRDAELSIHFVDEIPDLYDKDVFLWIKKFVVGVEFWRSWI